MAKVYVSSTIADLEQERRAVLDWLVMSRHQAVDSYRPNGETVREGFLDNVATYDLYVLILGHRYGFVPADDNPDGLSVTELEFRRAGEFRIPRIALLRTSIPDVSLSDVADPQKLALVLAFRDEVASNVRPAEFHDLQGLVQGLSTGVQHELDRAQRQLAEQAKDRLAPDIFISYRRDDAGREANHLQYTLSKQFPAASVFMDLHSIEGGADFRQKIEEAVASSGVLVALIGPQWATLADERGRRRLDNSDDFVRFELRTALRHRVRVIPVLVDGAKPLQQEQLPDELKELAWRQAMELSGARFRDDMDRLLKQIEPFLTSAQSPASASQD